MFSEKMKTMCMIIELGCIILQNTQKGFSQCMSLIGLETIQLEGEGLLIGVE